MFGLRLGRKRVKNLNAVLRGLGLYIRLLTLGGALVAATPARADLPVRSELPIPCTTGCSTMGGANGWISSGQASLASNGSTLYVNQQSDKAILNWQSFNISAGNKVQFNQPDAGSVALNRIYQADPSNIQGALSANGQVFLINRNGMLFGPGARVDVNSLTVSTLNIDDNVFTDTGILQEVNQGKAAFVAEGPMGSVRIETGAELRSVDGGRIMILAPVIENSGKIETPDGQTILAASQDKVWLQRSDDPNLRGLLVEVGTGGDVRNLGEILAKRGNITMMGFAVNQDGLVSATTTVNNNGSIRLIAHAQGEPTLDTNKYVLKGISTERDGQAARVTFGAGSRTEVLPELDDRATAVDQQKQALSQVDVVAKEILLSERAQLVVPGGNVNLTATANPGDAAVANTERNGSRVIMESGTLIDVGGTTSTELAMDRNEIQLELFSNELKDSPLQRDGVLRGKKVIIDIRKEIPIADISGELAKIKRDVGERLAVGGTVNVASEGDFVMAPESKVDISGGKVNYDAGWMNTTKLVSDSKIYDISDADPNLIYDGVLGEYTRTDAKWGMKQAWTIAGPVAQGYYEDKYTEGRSAGTFNVTSSALRLEGDVLAGVTYGNYQRNPKRSPELGTLNLDLVKLGQGGLKYDPATVKFAHASAEAYDPETALDPSKSITIDPRLLQEGGVGRLILNHNGSVDIPEGTTINLPAGGEFKVSGSGVSIDGSITVPAGRVSLATIQTKDVVNRPITMGERSYIDVSGVWVNDYSLTNVIPGTEPLLINGGAVALNAQGDLKLASGSVIEADGGAFVDAKGKLSAGNGGDISLLSRVSLEAGAEMELGGDIHAYAAGKGGTLSIETNTLRIGQSGSDLPGELLRTPEFFQQGGFSSYTLTSNLGGIIVAADTVVQPRASTLMLEGDYLRRATGSDISEFSSAVMLPDDRRRPVDLSLNLSQTAAFNFTPAHFEIEAGARIEADSGAKLSLSSDHGVDINGVLSAPAGEIDLQVSLPKTIFPEDIYYHPELAIHLGSQARLLAQGVVELMPNTLDLNMGEVLSGGQINVTADNGYIVTDVGSLLDVSGTAAELLVRSQGSAINGTLQTIASNAGAIRLTAAEGMVLSGTLTGHAGGSGAVGGELSVALDALKRGNPLLTPPQPYLDFPTGPRVITLAAQGVALPAKWKPGTALPGTMNGQAVVSANAVEDGGFDSLTLRASDMVLNRDGARISGQINLDHVNIDLKRSVVFDAPLLNNVGGDSRIAAAYVALADSGAADAVQPESNGADGQLEIEAQHIDLIGNVTLQGWQQASLNSEGDIRMRGLLPLGNGNEWRGSLNSFGNLELSAAQLYPSTLTQYSIEVTRSDGNLSVLPVAAADPAPVLSAGSNLIMKADNIYQGGVVKAPFGDIQMIAADTLVLAKGSLTSTSASGETIPFGRTENGLDWIYPVADRGQRVFGQNSTLPAQNLSLQAPSVVQQAGATIDVSGGGDLYAYQFVAGPGGSHDVLDPKNSDNTYAVLPWLRGYGPYDPLEFGGTDIKPGDSIHLAAGSGLAEGDYLLLPARYALLPGAYLVTKQAGTQDFGSDLAVRQTDSSILVGGYRTVAGTDIRESRWSGYTVAPGAIARTRSEYQDSFANDFIARHAIAAKQPVPLLPQDAGRVAISVTDELQLDGELRANADHGRGARVDLEAEKLTIVSQRGADDGTVQVTVANLNSLGAESILLGGHRMESGDAVELVTTATKVTVKSGAQITVPELLLAASDETKVESGTKLVASGKGAAAGVNYTLHGDGALLQISAGAPLKAQRIDAQGVKGDLLIDVGATLGAAQSMFLESSHDTVMSGTLDMHGGNLSLGAKHISLGDAPVGTSGLVLTQEQLSSLQMDQLTLNSRETVDLYGNVNLNMKQLTLAAAGLVGHGTEATTASIVADILELKNVASTSDSTATDAAHLDVTTDDLLLGAGEFKIDGFASADISARRQVRVAGTVDRSNDGDKTLNVDGDLRLRTAVITAESGSDSAISARGKLEVLALASPQKVEPAGLGARLSFEGSDVTFGTSVQLPSGDLRLKANKGDVHLIAGAAIDVSGRIEQFSDMTVATPAGAITLHSVDGDVILDSGATILLKGVAGADAGTLNVSAASGELILKGSVDAHDENGADQGIVKLDLGSVADFSTLNRKLNESGFGGERKLRQRHGDLIIAEDDSVNARQVRFSADDGAIEIHGHINSAAEKGGEIVLQAKDDVHLYGTTRIDARATGSDEAGGHVILATTDGVIAVDAENEADASVIDVSGTRSGEDAALQYVGGKVEIRAPRVGAGVAVSSLDGTIRGAESIAVQAFRSYEATEVDSALQNQIFADTKIYMTHAADIATNLNMAGDSRFHLQPGVDIYSAGDLTVSKAWDFAARDKTAGKKQIWRFNSEPGMLMLRAAGKLNFDAGLSDGIETGIIRATASNGSGPVKNNSVNGRLLDSASWSYQLTGGSDLGSADMGAVVKGEGGVVLAEGVQVRTGSGNISVASGGVLNFSGEGSSIFSAGQSGGYGTLPLSWVPGIFTGVYPVRGGEVNLQIAGDILSADSTQFINDWLFRMGNFGSDGNLPTAWSVNFKDKSNNDMFKQNIAAFGGGDVTIDAGGSIKQLSVVAPGTGQPQGTPANGSFSAGFLDNEVRFLGGGNLNVKAGGDINGGTFYVDGGAGRLRSGGALNLDDSGVGAILALGRGRYDVLARNGMNIETVLNPTALPPSSKQAQSRGQLQSFFFTYGPDSGIKLDSLAGDITLRNETSALTDGYPGISFQGDESTAVTVYPGDLEVSALRGSIYIDKSFKLFPSPHGSLSLLADEDIKTETNEAVAIKMSDTDLELLPSIANPAKTFADAATRLDGSSSVLAHKDDGAPVNIVARKGSIESAGGGQSILIFELPKQASIVAGQDIRDLQLHLQNLTDEDVTLLQAGRDIMFSSRRDADGSLITNASAGIELAGPGELNLVAGRDVDLGTSEGVVAIGNTRNLLLTETGANVTVEAGISKALDYVAYLTHYAQLDGNSRSEVATAMRRVTGNQEISDNNVFAALDSLSQEAQRKIALMHFYGGLSQSAREAATGGNGAGYQRGYDAIATLFGDGMYKGDVRLYFSRIHTVDGGDINMVVPGGLINAGLAATNGFHKEPSELGIVAQRSGDVNIYLDKDMLVNQSRVFALDGGDIVIWSQHGNIDAGRGAKSAIAAPPPIITFDETGKMKLEFPAAIAGSGIRTAVSTKGREPGSTTLAAPRGVVNASDAGIDSAGALVVAATAVLGAGNISAGGESVGVPSIEPPSVPAGLANAGNSASNASSGGEDLAAAAKSTTPLADSALAFLEVEVLGFGGASTAGVAGAMSPSDVAAGDDENKKSREQGKGSRLAKESDDVLPKAAEGEKPAGRVATTHAQ